MGCIPQEGPRNTAVVISVVSHLLVPRAVHPPVVLPGKLPLFAKICIDKKIMLEVRRRRKKKLQTEKTSVFTWWSSYFSRNPDRGARLCFTELPSSSDEYSVFTRVFVGILQRGYKANPADPQPEVMGVPFCRFVEVVRILDVRNTEADP